VVNIGYIGLLANHDLDAPLVDIDWNFQFGTYEASFFTMGATF